MFTIFLNLSSLCIKSSVWSELEASRMQKVGCLSMFEISLVVHDGDFAATTEIIVISFMSECVARWPGFKWRWGLWNEHMEDVLVRY
ncbi:hypothetical protein Hanom_Chr03g00180451 [Helianthus anomalus]